MFYKFYVNVCGFSTWVKGVYMETDDGELAVRITSVGRADDEWYVGQVIPVDELQEATNGDRFILADLLAA